MAPTRATALALALATALAVGADTALAQCCGGGMEVSGHGAVQPPPMTPPPVTNLVPTVPSEVIGAPNRRPEMAPPIDIGDIDMDLGELAPHKYPPRIEISERGTRKVTYFDPDGNPVSTVYIFPNDEVYANDPTFEGARPHLHDAELYHNLENAAWVVKVGSDVAIIVLGGPASAAGGALKAGAVSVVYEGAKAAGDTGATRYQEGASAGEVAQDAAVAFARDAAVAAAMEVTFAGAAEDAGKALGEARAAVEAGTETVQTGRRVLRQLPSRGKVAKAQARRVLNQARELGVTKTSGRKIRTAVRAAVQRAERQIAEGGRNLARAQVVETMVGFGKDAATKGGQALATDVVPAGAGASR
jgi:hypothetical protein